MVQFSAVIFEMLSSIYDNIEIEKPEQTVFAHSVCSDFFVLVCRLKTTPNTHNWIMQIVCRHSSVVLEKSLIACEHLKPLVTM